MVEAQESQRLLAVTKRCLKTKGLTYRDLATRMSLSESSVKRLFASGNWSMRRFEQVCKILEMSIFDMVKLAREETGEADSHVLTREQEAALAGNPDLLIGFHLILNGWKFDRILQSFSWTEPQLVKIFTSLDKLGLISLQPQNRVRVLTASNIRWRKDGPIRARYQKHVFGEFLNDRFNRQGQFLDFEIVELSAASSALLARKLETLLKDINELAAMDHSLQQGKKSSTGILLAMRPWVYSLAVDAMSEEYKSGRSL